MIFLSYATMLFNIGAAMNSFVLVKQLTTKVSYRNAKSEGPPYPSDGVNVRVVANRKNILQRYGLGKSWVVGLFHCKFSAFDTYI